MVPTIIFLLFISGQFKWLFDIVNGFFLLAFIVPIAGALGLRFWYNLNVVQGKCPNCGAEVRLPNLIHPIDRASIFWPSMPPIVPNP